MFSPSPDVPKDIEIIYLPYWRFKGVRYSCHLTGVETRFLDISTLALEGYPWQIPFSLGFRSQALPLKLISSKTQGKFVRPLEFKATIMESDRRGISDKKNQAPAFKEDIGEMTSLIYSPFYIIKNQIIDGILNKPIQGVVPEELDSSTLDICRPEKETIFVSGLCPGCGWDLEGNFDSLVLVCKNCQTLWKSRGNRLGKIKFKCAIPQRLDDVMIPFWKIKADITSITLKSYADLVRMGNLPKSIQPEWEDQELYFWIPAFKIRPKVFLRLNTQLAIAQPTPPLEKKIRENTHLPINLPSSEAVQSIKITLASLVRPLKDHLPALSRSKVTPKEITLVFLPFEPGTHEYVNQGLNMSINKNILALSNNL